MLALVLVAIDLFKQQHVGFCGVLMSSVWNLAHRSVLMGT